MLDTLRAWLNGTREYFTGVSLFEQLSDNKGLLMLLRKGKTEFTNKRLQDELMQICLLMKASATEPVKTDIVTNTSYNKTPDISKVELPPNTELHAACIKEANLLYKELMNERALLFASTINDTFEDVNRIDLVEQRSKLCVDVVIKYQRVSQLFDRADHVKRHGVLPAFITDENDVKEYDALPDHLVKQTLDNLRKNINKLKKREQTAERIALVQKHQENIKKLEARWLLLKPHQ